MLTGCQTALSGVGVPKFQFDSSRGQSPSGDSFTCLGITDDQWKSVLQPGYYQTASDPYPCQLTYRVGTGIDDLVVLRFATVRFQRIVSSRGPIWTGLYTTYAFYRFPEELGIGGAVWMGPSFYGAMASPDATAEPVVGLMSPDGTWNIGVVLEPSPSFPNRWPPVGLFKIDPIVAMTELVFWAVSAQAEIQPSVFPNPYPTVNSSPYIPPPSGGVPTATTTLSPYPPDDTGTASSSGTP